MELGDSTSSAESEDSEAQASDFEEEDFDAGRPEPETDDRDGDDEMEEMPQAVKVALEKTGVAQSRCGLLAGFTYYELSRQSHNGVESVPAYALLLLSSFTLAATSTALATFVRIYMRRVHFTQWPQYVDRVGCFVNLAYLCCVLSSFTWVLALSLMGFAYNGYNEYKNAPGGKELALHLARLPIYCFWPTLVACLAYIVWIACLAARTRQDVKESSVSGGLADMPEQTIRSIKSASDATVYLLGFTGAGLARYHQVLAHEGAPHEQMLNVMYWALINMAGAMLAFVNICGTNTAVIMYCLPPARQVALHRRASCLTTLFCHLVNLAILGVVLAAMFIGWGCSTSCHKANTVFDQIQAQLKEDSGVCFGRLAHVPAVVCFCAGVALVAFIGHVRLSSREAEAKVKRLEEVRQSYRQLGMNRSEQGDTASVCCDSAAMQKTLEVWGQQASLFSGFVFYNIACFDTDILHAPITARFNLGVTGWNVAFLLVTVTSFAFGVVTVVASGAINAALQQLRTRTAQSLFATAMRPVIRLTGILRTIAMYCFMASFALLGIVKMVPARVEPAVVTGVAVVLYMRFEKVARQMFEKAKKYQGTVEDLGPWTDAFGVAFKVTYPRIVAQMAVSSQALFFGAFAYNAVNFLFRPEETFGAAYAFIMGTCFMLSLCLVLTENTMSLHFTRLPTEAQKECYGRQWATLLRGAWQIYKGIYQTFLLGVALLGPVKLWLFNYTSVVVCDFCAGTSEPDADVAASCQQVATELVNGQRHCSIVYGWMVTATGIVFLFASKWCETWVSSHSARISRQFAAKPRVRLSAKASNMPFKHVMDDVAIPMLAATFQTGNVFYEVVFTVINPERTAESAVYLGFSLLALGLGSVTIVFCQCIIFWMNDFPTSAGKRVFAAKIRPVVEKLFNLYYVSLLSWLVAMLASSSVKYPKEWYFSLVTCSCGLAVIAASWQAMLCKSRGYLAPGEDASEMAEQSPLTPPT